MPTYEYACAKCGIVEVFQSMRDDPLKACPDCGSKRFQRQISGGAGVIFKGSGFYETDYNRSSDYQKSAKSETGSSSSNSQSSEGSSGSTGGAAASKTDSAGTAKKADTGSSS